MSGQNFTPNGNGGSIDVNSFTPDELLKHIYRKLEDMNGKMDERDKNYKDDKKGHEGLIQQNRIQITELRTIIQEKDRSFKTLMGIISIGFTLISFIIGIVVYIIG